MKGLTTTKSGKVVYHPSWMRELQAPKPIPEPKPRMNRSLDQVEKTLKRIREGDPYVRHVEGRTLTNGFHLAATDGYRALLRPGLGREPVLESESVNTLPERSVLLHPEIYLSLMRMTVCTDKEHGWETTWNLHPNGILITAKGEDENGQGIQGKDFAPLIGRNGFFPCFKIKLNSKYVLDILGIVWPLEMRFQAPDEPVLFRPLSDEWRYVLMPIK